MGNPGSALDIDKETERLAARLTDVLPREARLLRLSRSQPRFLRALTVSQTINSARWLPANTFGTTYCSSSGQVLFLVQDVLNDLAALFNAICDEQETR